MWGGGFCTSPRNSWSPVECPTIEPSLDTIYLKIASDSSVKGSILQVWPLPPIWMSIASPGCYLCFCTTWLWIGFLFGFHQFVCITQKIFYSIQKQPRRRSLRAKCGEKARRFHTFLNVLGFTNLEALQIPSFLAFMETWLHSHDWLNQWLLRINPIPSPSSFPEDHGVQMKVPIHCHDWVPGWLAPILKFGPKLTS